MPTTHTNLCSVSPSMAIPVSISWVGFIYFTLWERHQGNQISRSGSAHSGAAPLLRSEGGVALCGLCFGKESERSAPTEAWHANGVRDACVSEHHLCQVLFFFGKIVSWEFPYAASRDKHVKRFYSTCKHLDVFKRNLQSKQTKEQVREQGEFLIQTWMLSRQL